MRHRKDGDIADISQMVVEHPDLMPELGEELKKLDVIERGRRDANAAETSLATWFTDLLPGYKFLRPIHRGGQGDVYEAIQKSTKQHVAIKILRENPFFGPNDLARFELEVQILGALHHPNIVTIHDSGTVAGQSYHVMDYVAGEPLDVYMHRVKPTIDETLRLFQSICNAVNAAHLRGVIHRDLKPSNLRIDSDGEPHILDFGLAKITKASGPEFVLEDTMTATGHFVGSLPWASPEQVEAQSDQMDVRSDVYSLGVILYHMFTGRFPYTVVGNVRSVMDHILKTEPIRPSTIRHQINNEVETLVLKCLSKEPERRYQSAGDIARDVERYLAGQPIEAKRDSTWYIFSKTIRRNRLAMSVVTAFVLLVMGFGFFMWRENELNLRLATCLQDLFEVDPDDVNLPFAEHLDAKAKRIMVELDGQPHIQVKVMEAVSNGLLRVGEYERAKTWLQQIVSLHLNVLSSDNRTVANCLRLLASSYTRTGDFFNANESFQKAVQMLRHDAHDQDPQLAELLRTYGQFLAYQTGDYDRGSQMLEESLSLLRSMHTQDHPLVAGRLVSLAKMKHDDGDYATAESYYLESLAMEERLPPNQSTWHATLWLGMLYKDMANYTGRKEKYAEAKKLILESLKNCRASNSDTSSTMGEMYLSLGKLHADMADWPAAAKSSDRALEVWTIVRGLNDYSTAQAITLWARVRIELGYYEEAEQKLRDNIIVLKKLRPGHWELAKAQSFLGAALTGKACTAQAQQQLDTSEQLFKEAEELVLNAYPIIQDSRGEKHYRTREAIERIINLYHRWSKPDKTNEWRERLKLAESGLLDKNNRSHKSGV